MAGPADDTPGAAEPRAEPLEVLYEAPGRPHWRLPPVLAAFYGDDLGFAEPCGYATWSPPAAHTCSSATSSTTRSPRGAVLPHEKVVAAGPCMPQNKGIPKIETLKATKRLPRRYRLRWDHGSKSFTDTDRAEVLRFATDLVKNDYNDPRDQGKLYGKQAREAPRKAAAVSKEDHSFRKVAERYLDALDDVTPGYLQRYRGHLKNHAYPAIGDTHVRDIRVEDVDGRVDVERG